MEPSHSELDEYCKFQRYQYAPAHEMSRALASGRGSVPLCLNNCYIDISIFSNKYRKLFNYLPVMLRNEFIKRGDWGGGGGVE